MKVFCISDNIDTQMGLRLAGIEGVVLHEKDEILEELEKQIKDPDVAIILMTTKVINSIFDIVSNYKLNLSKPLLVEIPDRHGSVEIGEVIDKILFPIIWSIIIYYLEYDIIYIRKKLIKFPIYIM